MTRRIVAIGGAGFEDAPALVPYLLSLARGRRVLLLPTAAGDDEEGIKEGYVAFRGCDTTHLELFRRTVGDLRELLLAQDLIYVGGGNTANMLAVWRVHGVDAILRDAYAAGTVLCGSSAGCICWFECGITDSFGLGLAPLHDGLGLLAGSTCPHYDSEERRRPVYTDAVRKGFASGIALDDAVAARYDDEQLVEVVSARPGGRAFRVESSGEEPLEVRRLG